MTTEPIRVHPSTRDQWRVEAEAMQHMAILTAIIGPKGLAPYLGPASPAAVGRRGDAAVSSHYAAKGGFTITATRGRDFETQIITSAHVAGLHDGPGIYQAQRALEDAGVPLLP